MKWHDVVGGAGAAIILVSYFLLQLQRVSSSKLSYSLLNGIGALLILVSLWTDFNLSAFVVEAFWLAISALGVIRCMLYQSTPPKPQP
jgi:hypothetical protein